jgi:hypothetical protein
MTDQVGERRICTGVDINARMVLTSRCIDSSRFGIFDTFVDDNSRNIHLNGEVARLLSANAGELFAEPPGGDGRYPLCESARQGQRVTFRGVLWALVAALYSQLFEVISRRKPVPSISIFILA